MTTLSAEQRKPTGREVGCWRGTLLTMVIIVLVLLFAWHILAGGALVIYSPPVRGRVIDAHTGRPLPGAVVVGQWIMTGWKPLNRIHASETITKADGTYVLPGMPLRIRGLLNQFDSFADPELWIYKPGYAAERLNNSALGKWGYASGRVWSMSPRRECYWNGKTIPLYPVRELKSEALILEAVMSDVVRGGDEILHPRQFPLLWQVLREGSRRVPRSIYTPSSRLPEDRYQSLMREHQ